MAGSEFTVSVTELFTHSCFDCPDSQVSKPASPGVFTKAAKEGCMWQQLLVACSDRFQKVWPNKKVRSGVIYHNGHVQMRTGEGVHHLRCLMSSTDQSDLVTDLVQNQYLSLLSGHTDSKQTLVTIQKWLRACESDHENCSRITHNYEWPNRVRLLRLEESSVVLIESKTQERYACLSHCWGPKIDLIKTARANVASFMSEGIALNRLPLTFQQCIEACKRLGIRYLWIDSLCIIQDDEQDWREQASQMAAIYEGGTVTLAAVKAQNSSQGLFAQTYPAYMAASLPRFPWLQVRQDVEVPDPRVPTYRELNSDGWILYKRGWSYQELSLSPRVIHFSSQEVMWHCRHLDIRESDPKGNLDHLNSSWAVPNIVSIKWKHDDLHLQRQWYTVVSAYSWRSLSFRKDKLPAVAAFASRMQLDQPSKSYLAGLWADTLLYDLLWYIARLYKMKSPVVHGLVTRDALPTWSWASRSHPVEWDRVLCPEYYVRLRCTEVITMHHVPRGPPVLGEIEKAVFRSEYL